MRIDEDTVRSRVKRLEQIGFIRSWHIHPNPHVLGTKETAIWFDVSSSVSKAELIGKIRLMPNVLMIINEYGSHLAIIFFYEDEFSLRKTAALIQTLSNTTNMVRGNFTWPECRVGLSKTDWRIVERLNHDPRKSHVAISREIGISSRTVARRLQRLTRAGALFTLPTISPKALEGTMLAHLNVGYAPKDMLELDRKIMAKLDDCTWHLFHMVSPDGPAIQYSIFNLAISNISRASDILNWVREQAGVQSARVDLLEDHLILLETLDKHLKRRLAEP
jgi:DNA-binding Lrp family transcriptional regulator